MQIKFISRKDVVNKILDNFNNNGKKISEELKKLLTDMIK